MISKAILHDVLHAYYVEKLSQDRIAKKFAFPLRNELFLQFDSYHHDETCTNCNSKLASNFANRAHSTDEWMKTGYSENFITKRVPLEKRIILTKEKYKIFLPKCENCDHYPDPTCNCQNCMAHRKTTHTSLVEQYRGKLINDGPQAAIDSLTAKQLLLSVYYHTVYQNSFHNLVRPSTQFSEADLLGISKEKLEALLKKWDLLCITPDSISTCIEMTSTTSHTFHKARLKYHISGSNETTWIHQIRERCRELLYDQKTRADVIRLWGELAVSEAIHYFENLCLMHRLPLIGSARIISHIKYGINNHGLFKTIAVINFTLNSAKARLEKEKITITHANNHVQYTLNSCLHGSRKLTPANRSYKCFSEPSLVNIFCEYYLPFTIDYENTPLKELTINMETTA